MEKNWYNIALERIDQENYAQAIIAIKKYVDQNPKNKFGKLLQAIIYGHLSFYSKVLEILDFIPPEAGDDRDYAKVYYIEKADTYREIGNYDSARLFYDKAIDILPEQTGAYIKKGAFLASIGDYEGAKIEHLKATQLDGDPEEAFYNLALISRAELKLEEAQRYCEKSLEIDPDNIDVLHCYRDVKAAIELRIND